MMRVLLLIVAAAVLAGGCGIANDIRNSKIRDAELNGQLQTGMSIADVEAISGRPVVGGTHFVRDGVEVLIWNSGSGVNAPYEMEFHDGRLFSWHRLEHS